MGTVYKRGNIWWIRYRRSGKNIFESSESKKKTVAVEKLKQVEGDIASGRDPRIDYKRTTFEELAEDFLDDYKVNHRKSLQRAEISVDHLTKFFGGMKASRITTAIMKKYRAKRLEEGKSNGTVNRELRALGRMLQLGYEDNKVFRKPHIPMLKEGKPRQGFFEHEDYLDILKKLPTFLRPITTFAYRTGWRKNEILNLTWDKVDLKERTITLETGETKNDEARDLYLDDDLLTLLRGQKLRREKDCPYVFHNKGKKVKDFRGSWKKACKEARIEGKIFHDFRRTAVRNFTRSGTQESVAMKITGHKTRAVFDRYNITSKEDIKKAMERSAEDLQSKSVTKSVTIGDSEPSSGNQQQAKLVKIVK